MLVVCFRNPLPGFILRYHMLAADFTGLAEKCDPAEVSGKLPFRLLAKVPVTNSGHFSHHSVTLSLRRP